MSLLHQDTLEEIDDAALGEEFTKGSSHVVWASVIAAVVVMALVVIALLASRKPPVATGEIVQLWAFPQHGETSGIDANGEAMAKESFDQVLLIAHVKLHNQSKHPLQLQNVLANIKQADGIPLSVSAGNIAQYQEALLAYPQMAVPNIAPLSPHAAINPEESLEGNVLWVFRMTRQQWEARKSWQPDPDHDDPGSNSGLNFTFAIQYQKNLVLAPASPVMER
ncbi:MAG: hypothetical protein WAN35_19480 [Terracidiphilus sp.]